MENESKKLSRFQISPHRYTDTIAETKAEANIKKNVAFSVHILHLFTQLRRQGMSERILFALSTLVILFVTPPTVIRLIAQDWAVFTLDVFLIISAAFIFYNTLKGRYLSFLKLYMCCLVSIGASLTVVFGGIEQVYWIFPTVLTAYFLVKHQYAFLFVIAISAAIAPTIFNSADGMHTLTIYLALFGTATFVSVFSKEIMIENKSLNSLASIDPLTGVGNRRLFAEEASQSIAKEKLDRLVYSMIVIDIDDFKVINDTKGHQIGDLILKHLCSTVTKRLADSDSMYRLGGEEFAVIVAGDNASDGMDFAELIQFSLMKERVQELPIYTVSMGVAMLRRGETIDNWLHRADVAMYTAKRKGKNTIINDEDLPKGAKITDFERHRSSRATQRS